MSICFTPQFFVKPRLNGTLTSLVRKTAKQFFDRIIKMIKHKFFNLDFVNGMVSKGI